VEQEGVHQHLPAAATHVRSAALRVKVHAVMGGGGEGRRWEKMDQERGGAAGRGRELGRTVMLKRAWTWQMSLVLSHAASMQARVGTSTR
jgi:hypothetical protein